MMNLINKNFQENVRESHHLSACFSLRGVLVKTFSGVEQECTRLDHMIRNGRHVQWEKSGMT
jgi:hypothetical protein